MKKAYSHTMRNYMVVALIAAVVLFLTIFTEVPLFVYVIIAGTIGVLVNWFKDKKKNKEVEKQASESEAE